MLDEEDWGAISIPVYSEGVSEVEVRSVCSTLEFLQSGFGRLYFFMDITLCTGVTLCQNRLEQGKL